jgi:hypothetical protein
MFINLLICLSFFLIITSSDGFPAFLCMKECLSSCGCLCLTPHFGVDTCLYSLSNAFVCVVEKALPLVGL